MKRNILKELFEGFLRTRRFARHFRRLALFETLRGTGVSRAPTPTLAKELLAAANCDVDTLLRQLESTPDGITEFRADAIRQRVGPNEIEHERPLPWGVHLWHCYKNPQTVICNAGGFMTNVFWL